MIVYLRPIARDGGFTMVGPMWLARNFFLD